MYREIENIHKITKAELHKLIKDCSCSVDNVDLSGQNLTDEDIKLLCESKIFRPLMTINLNHNKQLTDKSIEYILSSNVVGSLMDMPNISGKYGVPCAKIEVHIKGTEIAKNMKSRIVEKHRFGFRIAFRCSKYPPAIGCVKFVTLNDSY